MSGLTQGNVLQGRYEISKIVSDLIGQTIYCGKDKLKNNRPVYIRELELKNRTGVVMTPEAINNMVHILSSISFRTIPQFVECIMKSDSCFIVEELIEGSTLEEQLSIRQKPFDFKEVYNWMVELSDTLYYLHGLNQPIIVRAIVPSAIKITPMGDLKLVDFSFARFYKENADLDTLFIWNPGYTSPEQYGSQKSDVRSDVYGFGALFYKLFTLQDIGNMRFEFPPVSKFNPSFTPSQDEFIAKCLDKDPEKRFQSSFAIKQALMNMLPKREEPVPPEPIEPQPQKKKGFSFPFFKKK